MDLHILIPQEINGDPQKMNAHPQEMNAHPQEIMRIRKK